MASLAGKTIFISGASRGIGKSIALRAAQDGANIIIAAKTATAHPKLPGTIYTAAEESKTTSVLLIPYFFFYSKSKRLVGNAYLVSLILGMTNKFFLLLIKLSRNLVELTFLSTMQALYP